MSPTADGDQIGRGRVRHGELEGGLAGRRSRLALGGQLLAAHHRRHALLGTTIRAVQLWRMPGLSWVGIQLRLLRGWPWL
jgi:hypothetical protein